jgi:zinc D-Ala-D-Ala carboxypeptidase
MDSDNQRNLTWSKCPLNLTTNFSLEEMTFSSVALRLGVSNAPGLVEIANLKRVAVLMETIRRLLDDRPIVVHSGYRSPELNDAIGGVETSAHCHGLACDFTCPDFGAPAQVALTIFNAHTEYDQLILEYGWVHVGLAQEGSLFRGQALTKRSRWAGYETGIQA